MHIRTHTYIHAYIHTTLGDQSLTRTCGGPLEVNSCSAPLLSFKHEARRQSFSTWIPLEPTHFARTGASVVLLQSDYINTCISAKDAHFDWKSPSRKGWVVLVQHAGSKFFDSSNIKIRQSTNRNNNNDKPNQHPKTTLIS